MCVWFLFLAFRVLFISYLYFVSCLNPCVFFLRFSLNVLHLQFLPVSWFFSWFSTFFRDFVLDSFALGKLPSFSGFDRISSLITCECYNFLPFLRFMLLRCRFIVQWLIWLSYIYMYSTRSMQSLHLVAGFCFCFLVFLSLLCSCGARTVLW